ncbi:hypothetical protein GIS00_14860 [Nakamurella sp. YIM 132087]|uniref:LamG domain-containing protein n=1 Tax=Nakamurella alba TaxID=2665158 RepID=A0A7K1FM41_9ACTN|nr:LamG-like jellyroll fold domain-containing protein [Nakamurella alba]MTD15221.1 hypothetical protein [Nakamurella alba]
MSRHAELPARRSVLRRAAWPAVLTVALALVPMLLWSGTGAVFTSTTRNNGNTFAFATYQQAVLADAPALYLPMSDAAPANTATTTGVGDISGNSHDYAIAAPPNCTLNGGQLLTLLCNGLLGLLQPAAANFQVAGPPGIHPTPSYGTTFNFGGTCMRPPATSGTNNQVSGAAVWNAPAPVALTLEAWVSTNSLNGGLVLGYAPSQETTTSAADRTLYLTPAGLPAFAVNTPGLSAGTPAANVAVATRGGAVYTTLTSPTAIRDGAWHHLVATVQPNPAPPAGSPYPAVLTLYVDGVAAVSYQTSAAAAVAYGTGKWRVQCIQGRSSTDPAVGTAQVLGGANPYTLVGSLSAVAIYYGSAASANQALPAATVLAHYRMGSTT